MPRNRFFHCLTLAAAFFLLWETQASAYETRVVTDHANTPLFQLRFFDQGEERREGGTEIPFTACPVEMAAVIPLTETVLC